MTANKNPAITSITIIYQSLCNRLSEIIPEKTRDKKIYPTLDFAGMEIGHDFYIGRAILFSLLMGLIGFLLPTTLFKDFFPHNPYTDTLFLETGIGLFIAILSGIIFFTTTALLEYLYVFYVVENRKRHVEAVFPDFLFLVASNLRAGMTPYSALKSAARPEFEPLSREIRIAASRSLGIESFTECLKQISFKIKSGVISETVSFFIIALKSGGHLAKMLEEASTGIRRTQEQKSEIESATKMYAIFIIFIIVIASPVLFALSYKFVEIMSAMNKSAQSYTSSGASLLTIGKGADISLEFMNNLIISLLAINAFLSSLFLGVIQKGKAKLGLGYFPLFAIASIVIFIASKTIFSGFVTIT